MSKYRTALDNGIERLFHYQSYKTEFLENTIVHGIVRFARASEFNDPWDCKPSFHVPDDKDRLRLLIDFMYSASERHTPEVDPTKRKAHADHLLNHPQELRKLLADTAGQMWTQMDRRYRMYCLSTEPDCPLMWGHYADHHRGVCLEFNAKTDFGSAIQVNYSAGYPQFSLDDGGDLSPFHSKSADWCYEEEYRLIAQEHGHELGTGTLMTHDDGLFDLRQGVLVSVIVGACACEATLRDITDMAKASGILVRKATRVHHRYELTIDPPI
jgi:hypothetical protein